MVVSPVGEVVAEAGEGEERLSTALDLAAVREAREANPSLANRRM
jgi:deaminated glutathione amidase